MRVLRRGQEPVREAVKVSVKNRPHTRARTTTHQQHLCRSRSRVGSTSLMRHSRDNEGQRYCPIRDTTHSIRRNEPVATFASSRRL